MLERVDLALIPAEAAAIAADAYLVVDVLRATTTIVTLFAGGLEDLAVAGEIGRAREMAAKGNRLLFGEVGGLPPEGFDFGNSPLEARQAPVLGRAAVLFTTNGTRALCGLAGRGAVFACAPANATAAARHVAERFRHVAVVCAGEAGGQRFALEDFAAAGIVVGALALAAPAAELGDAAALARHTRDLDQLIGLAEHADALRAIGLGADVDFCAQVDTADVVPHVARSGDGWAMLRCAEA